MATGTRVFLAVFALLVGGLVLYDTTVSGPPLRDLETSVGEPELSGVGGDPAAEAASARDPAGEAFAWEEEQLPAATEPGAAVSEISMGWPAPARQAPEAGEPPSMPMLGATGRLSPPAPPQATPDGHTDYFIQPGDSFSSIAAAWFGDEGRWELIAAANPAVDAHRLRPGTLIKLPPRDAQATSPRPIENAGGQRVHVVASGDTLSDIAQLRLGSSARWREIYQANRQLLGDDPHRLKVGMRLVIPEGR